MTLDDFAYDEWFVCADLDERPGPPKEKKKAGTSEATTRSASVFSAGSTDIRRMVREEIRAAMTELADRKSFAAASDLLTIEQVCLHLKMSRTTVWEKRCARRQAKTDEERAAAFAPEYGRGKGIRFKRSELDAWNATQKQ